MNMVVNFSEIGKNDVASVGGKGASLGEMTQAGIHVPPGFVLTTEAYRQYHGGNQLPQELIDEIKQNFVELGLKTVAVRSSAIAEDSADGSWAGQFETILNVTIDNLVEAIYSCWRSAKNSSVHDYAARNNVAEENLALGVVIQKMVSSDVSGVLFTRNPVTGDENQIMIEACWGLGEMLVQGTITPDNYIVDKDNLSSIEKMISRQEKMMINSSDGTSVVDVEMNIQADQKLSDYMIAELCDIATAIETHYGTPQDIEWAIEDGNLYILQSRPITTL